jgi:hypothetical protein
MDSDSTGVAYSFLPCMHNNLNSVAQPTACMCMEDGGAADSSGSALLYSSHPSTAPYSITYFAARSCSHLFLHPSLSRSWCWTLTRW